MSNKLRLVGKVAIITGAAGGIGEASARLFASHGAAIVIADIQDELGLAVAASIGPPDRCSYHHCDVRDENQVSATVDYTLETFGRLDIFFSNAGILGSMNSILDLCMDDFDRVMSVNLRGSAAAIKHAARAMVARGARGSIVCTGSVAACQGGRAIAYTASKHALVGLVRAAAGDLGAHGIRVNLVSPSGVATPMACELYGWSPSQAEEIFGEMSRLKGVVFKANHVAEAALFLASDESEFITGHNLVIDGGLTVVLPRRPQLDK